ncbi:flagellar basal-body MS-ring/collar protein FliF [Sulfobacillus harzensis]|uniref:Flagellar M-ring protein n=1 Tax=Sulfobacillus harzensis TaxID=2729629 RepID=A0A7Y0L577_9FIRM|nr:flagellar basal-body MS-ring/collar protein FliF [Sulfobacillus harzensis]NMP23547.1 flagellar M-ring protein FliF [Sulfobacillus harzensis]
MNDRAQAFLSRLREWWKSQPSSKKFRLGGLAALGIALLVAGWAVVTSPDWQPLYTNLNARTAGQITAQLNTMKIPYQLTQGGSTVEVPKKDVNQVRVSLADQNIPSTSVGLPSNSLAFSLGETSQEIQLTQLADLEATLEATINSINGIRSSRVLINQPSPSLFGETQSSATASVFVDLAPGASLSPGQVRGIMNLVAHSVSGLNVNQVSVVDQAGTVLSAGVLNNTAAASVSGMSGAELSAERQVSSQIRNNVQSMLSQVLGPGNAVVQVSAILNFNHSTVHSVQYGHSVLSSKQVQTKTSTGSTPPSTPVGTAGNTPTVTTSTAPSSSKSSSQTTISNYKVGSTTTDETVPAGQIQRLTVAVVVDKKLSAAETRQLKSLVANAAGVNLKAGDQLTVVGMPFNRTAVSQAVAAMQKAQRAQSIRQAVLVALAAAALLVVILLIRRTLKNRPAPEVPVMTLPTAVGAQEDFQEPMSVAELLNEMRAAKEPTISDQARQRLDEMAKNDPETAARLLKAWMEDES